MESRKLYHYCKLSTAIEFILPNKQLLLNPFGKTNDPRENKEFIFAGSSSDPIDLANYELQNQKMSSEIRSDAKLICFCGDRGPYFGYELSRMWAMYADNHKGVCIQLNTEKFLQENADKSNFFFKPITYFELDVTKPLNHKEVDYDRVRELGMKRYVKEDFRNEHLDYLFFTKNKEWESEHEYRVLYFSDDKLNEYCSIKNSLEAIYLGVDFNQNYLPAIKNNLKPDIEIHGIEYKDIRLITGRRHT